MSYIHTIVATVLCFVAVSTVTAESPSNPQPCDSAEGLSVIAVDAAPATCSTVANGVSEVVEMPQAENAKNRTHSSRRTWMQREPSSQTALIRALILPEAVDVKKQTYSSRPTLAERDFPVREAVIETPDSPQAVAATKETYSSRRTWMNHKHPAQNAVIEMVEKPQTVVVKNESISSRRTWMNREHRLDVLFEESATDEPEVGLVNFIDGVDLGSHEEKHGSKKGSVGGDDLACDGICWERCCKPRVYAQLEAVYYDRQSSFRNQPLVINAGNNAQLLGTGNLDFDYEPGLRVLLGIGRGPCCPCSSWELGYFGLFDQDSRALVLGNDNLALPGQLGAFNPFATADRILVDYSSKLHTFEVNCVKCICNCNWQLECLAGFRYLSFDETLRINAFDAIENGDGNYLVRTDNDLFGAQIGGRVRRRHGCRLSWEALGKAGLYGNAARQQQTVTVFPPFNIVNAATSKGQLSFVGEVGLSALYDLSPRWSIRAGYNLMWIQGLALAPNQLNFNVAQAGAGTTLNSTGGIFLHGATIGLEARF